MKTKVTPQRTCVACRKTRDKSDLIRIVRSPDGEITLDPSGKKNGRGAYICRSRECVEKCRKTKALNRTFRTPIADEVYAKLLEEFDIVNG